MSKGPGARVPGGGGAEGSREEPGMAGLGRGGLCPHKPGRCGWGSGQRLVSVTCDCAWDRALELMEETLLGSF